MSLLVVVKIGEGSVGRLPFIPIVGSLPVNEK